MAKPMPDLDPEELELNDLLGVATHGAHPRPELLLACEQGVLPPEPQARIEQHLKACALCTMLLADLATLARGRDNARANSTASARVCRWPDSSRLHQDAGRS